MLISFTIGYALFFLIALLQIPFIQCLIKYQNQFIQSLVSNIFHLFAFISVVQIWRSLWMICEQYIDIPGYHLSTLWLCYIGAYILLTCGLTACSLNGPGGGKDNYIDDQPILLCKFNYFSTLLKVIWKVLFRVNIYIVCFFYRTNQIIQELINAFTWDQMHHQSKQSCPLNVRIRIDLNLPSKKCRTYFYLLPYRKINRLCFSKLICRLRFVLIVSNNQKKSKTFLKWNEIMFSCYCCFFLY